MASRLRALVWDVDGTLAETEEAGHRPAFNQAFAEAGLAWYWDHATYARLLAVTGGKERLLAWWREQNPAAGSLSEAPAEMPAEVPAGVQARLRQLHQRKTALYAERVRQGAVLLRPGVRRLLDDARRSGLVLAIATTTTPDNVQALLQATLGADSVPWFAVIGAGDCVPAKKPAPDIYGWVLDHLGLVAGETLALEDSAAGAQAAVAAGVPVLVTRSHYSRGEAMPALLADLDGLGEPADPARGQVAGRPWRGVVDVATLRHWLSL